MWHAHTTVATIVERDNQFLMVHELSDGLTVYNQPAGHLEEGETLIDACIRETHEETGWRVKPTFFLGINQYRSPINNVTYMRHTFIAEAIELDQNATLDEDIIEASWLSYDEIIANKGKLRSQVVLSDIEQYRKGVRLDLQYVKFFNV